MVGVWRRAFCTTLAKNGEPKIAIEKQQQKQSNDDNNHLPSPKLTSRFAFFSNPSTPRLQSQPVVSTTNLRCKTIPPMIKSTASAPESPRLHCKTTKNSPRFFFRSNPSSPKSKSPSTFSILKASLRLSKNRCGICLQSVKTGQGTAIFTAECSHGFHFPCIAAHVRKQGGLVCPVCSAHWKELPLLALRPNQKPDQPPQEESKSQKKESVLKNLKVYNDDEPLTSPTASGGFVPIPESDENEVEDEEEFQGFFVNSNNSTLSPVKLKQGDLINPRSVIVTLSPEAAVISVNPRYETYAVVLKLKAPSSPMSNSSLLISSNRAPIDLVTVVDVSEKMSGEKQMSMKRAMKLVISSLSSNDRLSIVAFSATSKRLFPLRRMTANGRRSARRIIDALSYIGQDACAADAVKKAAKVLEDRRDRNSLASILLLTYGQENHISNNSSNPDRPRSIPIHTFHFTNEDSAYDHAPPDDGFTKCFAKVLSVVVQDLRLELDLVTGSAHAQISSIYTSNIDKPASIIGPGLVRFNDLYADEERELLLELKVPSSGHRSHHHHVLSVQSSYKDPSSQKLVHSKEQALLVPRPQSVRSSSPNIERLRFLFVTARASAESRRLIERNDFSGAHRMLSSARALLVQSRSGLADEYMHGLEAELATVNSHRQHQLQIQRPRTVEAAARKDYGVNVDEKAEQLTPTSAWRAAERLAKVAIMRKSLNRVSDLHGFENARF